jgi:DNA invertase Pin-like site-specific DNA recombinase
VPATMDGYIRVSRVSGRTGESYISPKVQRDKITGWAKLHDVRLGQVVVEEDVSGAKPVEERELGKLLKRVESGESEGIVAFKLSRFGRGALETLQAVERIRSVGGRLVTVEDGVDSAKPGGRLLLTVLAGLAEEELEQRRSGGATAVSRRIHWRRPSSRPVFDGVLKASPGVRSRASSRRTTCFRWSGKAANRSRGRGRESSR